MSNEMKPQLTEPREHYYWLDLVRFLAALTVVVGHCRGTVFTAYGDLAPEYHSRTVFAFFTLTSLGSEAVIVFFILSGFLVGGKALARISAGEFRTADYAIDRVSRIMTPLIPALGFTALVCVMTGREVNWVHFAGNLLSLQGLLVPHFGDNSPLWSLAYEVWFYLLMGAIGWAAMRRSFNFVAGVIVVLVAIVFTYLSATYLFCWLIGALAFLRRPKSFSFWYFSLSLVLMIYGDAGIKIGWDGPSVSTMGYRRWVPPTQISMLLFMAGATLLVQQLILLRPKQRWAIAMNNAGTVLAASSYTLYLTHDPFLRLATLMGAGREKVVNVRSVGIFVGVNLGILVGAWILYLLFEKHTPLVRKWLKGLLNSRTSKETMQKRIDAV